VAPHADRLTVSCPQVLQQHLEAAVLGRLRVHRRFPVAMDVDDTARTSADARPALRCRRSRRRVRAATACNVNPKPTISAKPAAAGRTVIAFLALHAGRDLLRRPA
jgi:hypothetical protein